MKGLFRTTVCGQLVRLVTRNALLQYPDEIDSALWKASIENSKAVATSPGEKILSEEVSASIHVRGPDASNRGPVSEDDILLVGWYGPNDPEVSIPLGHLISSLTVS